MNSEKDVCKLVFAYLAFAYLKRTFQDETIFRIWFYVGMIGFLDPPRTSIKEDDPSCRKAGYQGRRVSQETIPSLHSISAK